jgi:biotin--protein ligase
MKILIYDGAGVGPRAQEQALTALKRLLPDKEIQKISAQQVASDAWHDTASLFVMPGGRDVPYHAALSGRGNASIREFVFGGGAYLGFCAGAYYGCARVDFDRGAPFEVIGARELGFYPGAAIGPAYGIGSFFYDSDAGAKATKIDWCGEGEHVVYYDGGCYFQAEEAPNIKTLSRYLSLEGAPPAIVECIVGKGRAILSGVHPEFRASALGTQYGTPPEVTEALTEHALDGARLLAKMVKRLGV